MSELLDAAVSPANIIITSLTVFVLLYWVIVIIGLIDLDALDFDVDVDMDADADVDVEGASVDWFNSVLQFFNLGRIPLMIFLTFWIIPTWAFSIMVNHTLGNSSFLIGLAVLGAGLFVSLFLAKILTIPFVRLFDKLEREELIDQTLIGKMCIVTIPASDIKTGQATVKTSGAPHLLNVRTPKGIVMERGASGLVLEYQKELNIYLIEPFN